LFDFITILKFGHITALPYPVLLHFPFVISEVSSSIFL
jgi:hypothetical protein